jgi:hypothetical protein
MIGSEPQWSAAEWFRAAMESYVAEHQGCPRCRGRHCVFRSLWGQRLEYFCSACDFSVCLDAQTGRCQFTLGEAGQPAGCVLDEVEPEACPSSP